MTVELSLLHAWLAGRSVSRGLPAPVFDRGGLRVDIDGDEEIRRWLFAEVCPGLIVLGRELDVPRHPIKLCGPEADLRAALPPRWQMQTPSWFMRAAGGWNAGELPQGFRLEADRYGMASAVRILAPDGELAASGYGGETVEAFVYDRIVTGEAYRRRGLGRIVMAALRGMRRNRGTPELLTATEAGRALYSSLGWETLSPYVTAVIPAPKADAG